MPGWLAPRLRVLAWILPALLAALALGRLAFLGTFAPHGFSGSGHLAPALWMGLRMDARLAGILLIPALALLRTGGGGAQPEALPQPQPWKRWAAPLLLALNLGLISAVVLIVHLHAQAAIPWAAAFLILTVLDWRVFGGWGLGVPSIRKVWLVWALLVIAWVGLSYAVDFGAYAYLHTRLSGGLLGLLANPLLGLRMVWESYPVVWGGLGLALFLGGAAALLRLAGRQSQLQDGSGPSRGLRALQGTVAALFLLGCIWGRPGNRPLRWGDAYALGNTFASHAALNPVLSFLETLKDPSDKADPEEVRRSRDLMARHLGLEPVSADMSAGMTAGVGPDKPSGAGYEGSLIRRSPVHGPWAAGQRPNVVVLHLESFAAHKTGIFGNPLDPTPAFDRLAREGMLFEQCYAPAENTARAIYAVMFGQLDLSHGAKNTASRNPQMVDQYCLVNALEGYGRHYYLGGSGDWAQIRASLMNNIKGLRVHEGGFFKAKPVDVWGVADRDMLQQAGEHLSGVPEPFFALVQTAGNHPPFTVPPGMGYQRPTPSAGDLARGGFQHGEEFQSLGLLDWSLGQFFESVRHQPWFSRTIWVIYGDHGVPRGPHESRFGDVPMASHHVPLLFYAPGLLPAKRIRETVSQVDVMPMVMGLLGCAAENRTLGRDMLDPAFEGKGAALTFSPFVTPPVVGLVQGRHYLILGSDGRSKLYDLEDPAGVDRAPTDPETARSMTRLTRAYRAWAGHLLSHNKP